MKLHLLWIGKAGHPWIREGIDHYVSRISRFVPVRVVELKASKGWKSLPPPELMKREAELILKRLPPNPVILLLDVQGSPMDSIKFAHLLKKLGESGKENLVFVVGGAFGLHPSLLERGHQRLSLSPMTFTHDLARLVLTEQIYRACTINAGVPYHY